MAAAAVLLTTDLGPIRLSLRPDAAPRTVAHFVALVSSGALSPCSFYRSDFVIQFGLHGSGKSSPLPPLPVNESGKLSNLKGAVAVAHWDVPDCGNSEFFVSIVDSPHLDSAFGGYCVFAQVPAVDAQSWATISAIAASIASRPGSVVKVSRVEVVA